MKHVPKSFEQFGRTITVRRERDTDHPDRCGTWDSNTNTIRVARDIPHDEAVHTLLHETMHASFEALGREDLSADERLVDGLAGLLHQMLKTAKY